jgi:hypothetical protein
VRHQQPACAIPHRHVRTPAPTLRDATLHPQACGWYTPGTDGGMGVSAIASTAPGGALGGLLRDMDRLFLPPRPLPTPVDRARAVVDSLDWSQDLVVIWMPGTSEHDIAPDVAESFSRKHLKNVAYVPYQATWRLAESVPDGEAALRAVLDLVRTRRRPGQRVVLLGQSQGAWVISSVLRDPAYAAVVDKVGLVAHPALAPAHAHATTVPSPRLDAKVHEFNSQTDVVTKDLGRSGPAALDIVNAFAHLEIGHALKGALGIAFRDPGVLQALIASQLFRVKGGNNPHESGNLLDQAIDWVLASAAPVSGA